jgi:ABC-2 type transport system permease protein
MKKHLRIYYHILKFNIQLLLEYRLNALVQALFAFVFFIGLVLILEVVFSKTKSLGGWNKSEMLLLLGITTTIWGVVETLFFDGLRRLMMSGISTGEMDTILTKPVNPQFLATFSHFNVGQAFHPFGMLFFTLYWCWQLSSAFTLLSVLSFLILVPVCLAILYLVFSTYATFSFFMTRSSQIIRSMQTLTDHSQYPTSIYPKSIQFGLTVIAPVTFVGYIPTLFLLNKGNLGLFVFTCLFACLVFVINQFAWKYSLRHYSSASS